jgi:osmoprotectant transport system substrate-binding protein
MRHIGKVLTSAAAGVLMATSSMAATIVVGGKDFTEQLLLSEMTAQLLAANGFDVDKRDGMGSQLVRDAQINGQIDVYWEYTGTSLVTYNQVEEQLGADETYARVSELDAAVGLTWLDASAANNTYALAVQADSERTDDLESLSDLAAALNDGRDLVVALGAEFSQRPDGLPSVAEAYGFEVTRANLSTMDDGLTYQALQQGQVDLAVVFATDGRIEAFDFRVLEDDNGFFPNYALAPVIRTETLEANPEIGDALNALSAELDDSVMQRLNAEVDVHRKSIEEVSAAFLTDAGLI